MQAEQTSEISVSNFRNGKKQKRNAKAVRKNTAPIVSGETPVGATSDAPYGYRANGKPYLRRPPVASTKRKTRRTKETASVNLNGIQRYINNQIDKRLETQFNRLLTKAFK